MPESGGDPLSALRDIHLPLEPGFWPPAPGLWIATLLVLLTGVALALWRRGTARRRRPQREALGALAALRDALAQGERPHRIVADSTSLLRRVALSRYPRARVAGLTGPAWVEFLNAHGGGPQLTAGEAELLVTAPYAPGSDAGEAADVIGLCERWIRAAA